MILALHLTALTTLFVTIYALSLRSITRRRHSPVRDDRAQRDRPVAGH